MANLQTIKKTLPKTPGRTLLLEPWVFADDWAKKPSKAVCVGLRLMCDGDKSKARAEAETLALELHPKGGANCLDAFNDALMRQCAALGICDPNDVEKPSSILPSAEMQVRTALTSRGARFIFEALVRYEVDASPLSPEATPEELDELAVRLATGGLEKIDEERAATARRFLRYALDELRLADGDAAH